MTTPDNTILEFTILTEGDKNGEKIYVRAGDIRRIAKTTMKSESTYIIGQSQMVEGTVLFLHNWGGIIPGLPPIQTVQESQEQVIVALGGAVSVADIAKVA